MPSLPRRRSRAFTLMEIIVAMAIAGLLLGVAVLSLRGVNREVRIRGAAAALESSARAAMRHALVQQRPQQILFAPDGFAAVPPGSPTVWKRLGKGTSLEIRRWGETRWRKPAPDESWLFPPGRPCEPLSVRLNFPEGRYEVTFDPLTAAAAEEGIAVKP